MREVVLLFDSESLRAVRADDNNFTNTLIIKVQIVIDDVYSNLEINCLVVPCNAPILYKYGCFFIH